MEIRFAGMVDRPAADLVVEVEQARLVGNFVTRLGWNQTARGGWWNWRLLISGSLTQEAAGTDRNDLWSIMFGLTGLLRCVGAGGRRWWRHRAPRNMLFLRLGNCASFRWWLFRLGGRFRIFFGFGLGFDGRRT